MPSWVWIVLVVANVVGGGLLALPDEGPRLFSFSEAHGPSALDAVGAMIVLVGWLALDGAIVARRHAVRALGRTRLLVIASAVVIGIAILVPTIALDLGAWWVLGVALLAGAQIALGVSVGTDTRGVRR
jgi:hypothetical protein